ncbi:hypothetical protein BD309DRAFT_986693 [Dichomitus squalens]|uniref:Uncharacterized protein n=1 Tax=Dichomitus squalens TaxID=114155 RepID=A0A4Q9MVP2_9APHY|nr:uncharacterized protein DICSQDRAFT_133852 [Dichomitus squalens LYAD-421 SS1]EJF64186.1 hypothetical protein DICSQDRAFT_133852 [Dichomitus squalens LYAD-421 SS1]TBU30722.1 hypothetical protein BD311DRAFT_658438 [Dichomitus squalens]TBU49219.1 hypothetical protein BD309DRAFT_986693 [Dichomitus squalens]
MGSPRRILSRLRFGQGSIVLGECDSDTGPAAFSNAPCVPCAPANVAVSIVRPTQPGARPGLVRCLRVVLCYHVMATHGA